MLRQLTGRLTPTISKRTQYVLRLDSFEGGHRIPNKFGYTPPMSGAGWKDFFTVGITMYVIGQIIPFSMITHIRTTFKEARISEWYMEQYGCPIRKRTYA